MQELSLCLCEYSHHSITESLIAGQTFVQPLMAMGNAVSFLEQPTLNTLLILDEAMLVAQF